ncbi:hypothetical protein C922_03729, partial [Plasmodium inui San Antonio 1]
MASVLPGYLGELLNHTELKTYCQQKTASQEGICRFLKPADKQETVSEWVYDDDSRWKEVKNKRGIYSLTRGACIDIEMWLSTLSITPQAGRKELLTGCSYDDYKSNKQKNSSGESCIPKKAILRWHGLGGNRSLFLKQPNQKTLQVCMDIMRIILLEVGLTVSGRRVDQEKAMQVNICDGIYKRFKEWAGEEIAHTIMEQWFDIEGGKRTGAKGFSLSGRDLYEIMTEAVAGVGKGDKDTKCTRVTPSAEPNENDEVEYTTGSQHEVQVEETRNRIDEVWRSIEEAGHQVGVREMGPAEGGTFIGERRRNMHSVRISHMVLRRPGSGGVG